MDYLDYLRDRHLLETDAIQKKIRIIDTKISLLQCQLNKMDMPHVNNTVRCINREAEYLTAYMVRPLFAEIQRANRMVETGDGLQSDEQFDLCCHAEIINETWLYLRIPPLVHKKKRESTGYIWSTLNGFLNTHISMVEESGKIKWIPPKSAALVYKVHYIKSENNPWLADADNQETKVVQDCLVPRIIASDSMDYLSTAFIATPDDHEYCEIVVIPRSDLGYCISYLDGDDACH